MDSLKGLFGQPEWSLRHEAMKYIYTKQMKEGTSIREHVLHMMMQFNIAEVNGGDIDEANQRFQNLTIGKRKEVDANVATTKRKFSRGSSSKFKAGPSKPNRKIEKKEKRKTPKQNKVKKTTEKDRGGKYMDLRFQDYLIEHGIQSQLSTPSTPQQNGVSERRNRTLLDMVRSITSFAQLPDSFWGYALETTIYILNNVSSKSVSETPYELWKGRKDSFPHFRIWGCPAHVLVQNPKKLERRSKLCLFVGYLTDIKKWLAMQFQMKDLGNAQYVLGSKIVRNRKNKILAMSQTSYIDKMLSRYKMQNSKKGMLPYRCGIHLSKEQCPKTPQEVEDMSNIPYASAVGSLMYGMLYTRPNICYSVGMDLIFTRYTDSDFQSNKDARKSTSGSVFTLNGGAVVWRSIKQSCIVDSTMEVEYVATCKAAKEAIWLKKFFTDLEIFPNMHLPITLYCDNSGAVANSREPRSYKRGKHIERKYHLIREIVHRGDVIVTKISSEQNMADPFTKALTAKVFESHLHGLGLYCL
ncbi:gag/pol protein [Cucumis melo var. makuwa]|uniref:Gag/pol protein n=1 Tax=Cucumis melo var. makuwa TaxID=1194695 RepID=A0A5A7SPW4_CUCMM|nr:gag/pol protein [Cucumis melo var. makuwa]TYK16866.1 gag/pol protein [Cucumis melo var. makuwa]